MSDNASYDDQKCCNYFIGYINNDTVKALCIMLPQMIRRCVS